MRPRYAYTTCRACTVLYIVQLALGSGRECGRLNLVDLKEEDVCLPCVAEGDEEEKPYYIHPSG